MRHRHGKSRWALAAIPLLAMSFGLTALAGQPIGPYPTTDLSAKNCERFSYSVMCKRNYNPGGPLGCFGSMCDAVAAGAYQCKRTGTCEPL